MANIPTHPQPTLELLAAQFRVPPLSHFNLGLEDIDMAKAEQFAGGAYADVLKGWSKALQKHVAVKRIRWFLVDDETKAKRIVKEVKIWAAQNHPNILPLLGIFVDNSANFVSEYMVNGTATKYMMNFPRGGRKTLEVLTGITAGLAHLHSKGVTHGDLKCHSILISSNGTPRIAGFGASLSAELSFMSADTNMGTLRFMAPELIDSTPGRKHSKRSPMTDMWSFGMVIYELLSGKVPYHELNDSYVLVEILQQKLPEKPEYNGEEFQERLLGLCKSCWSFVPSLRPTSRAMLKDLPSLFKSE